MVNSRRRLERVPVSRPKVCLRGHIVHEVYISPYNGCYVCPVCYDGLLGPLPPFSAARSRASDVAPRAALTPP